jgi:PGF-CTERM protein
VAVRDSWGDTKEFGSIDDGETVTKTLDLRTDDSLLVTFSPNGGRLSGTVRYQETSYPRNPTVRVNGHATGYTGRLAPGETVSLSTNTSWLRAGTNTVTVEVGTESPADAPDQAVDLRYRHDLDPTGSSTTTPTPTTGNASTPVQNASGPTTGDGPAAPANATAAAVDSDSSTETTVTGEPTQLTDTTVVDVSFEQETIRSSEAATVVVTVRNPNETPDTHVVELEMFGQVINSREVTVPAGGETTVRFEHNIVAPGTYTARVDGETATIRVLEPDQTPAPSTPGATSTTFPGFGPAVVLVALLLAALALARRD